MVDISRVVVREIYAGMDGLFSTCAVEAGELIFVENYLVHESLVVQDDHFPLIVRLAVRIQRESHFEHLVGLGMRPECWTLGVAEEDAVWIKKLVNAGVMSADRMRDAYCLAAAYNVRSLACLHTGINEISIIDRAVIAPFACKANHSCSPNMNWLSHLTVEDVRERVVGMIAIRDISEGEELTYSYPPDQARDFPDELKTEFEKAVSFLSLEQERRKYVLRKLYGFDCSCARCTLFE